jgi:hypothetical protein
MADSPVRVFYQDDPRLAHTLVGRLHKEIAEKSEQVARGLAEDHEDYKSRVGYIMGLQRAVDMAENIDKELREDTDARRAS